MCVKLTCNYKMCLPLCVFKQFRSTETQTENAIKSPVSRHVLYEDCKNDVPHYIFNNIEMIVVSPNKTK